MFLELSRKLALELTGAQRQKAAPNKSLFARVTESLRRLRAECDKAPAWSPSFRASRDGFLLREAYLGEDKSGAVQPVWATVPSWDSHAKKSV
jgi:hypothetical protein